MAPVTLYDTSIALFVRGLESLHGILTKANESADASSFPSARLADDMFPLSKQVLVAASMALGTAGHLTSKEPTALEEQTTMEALLRQTRDTIDELKKVDPKAVEGVEDKVGSVKSGGKEFTFTGTGVVFGWGLPNFFFHITTAYDILRMKGVQLGKMDYVGAFFNPYLIEMK